MSDAKRPLWVSGRMGGRRRGGGGGGGGGEAKSGQLCESAVTGRKGRCSPPTFPCQAIKYERPKTAASILGGV